MRRETAASGGQQKIMKLVRVKQGSGGQQGPEIMSGRLQ